MLFYLTTVTENINFDSLKEKFDIGEPREILVHENLGKQGGFYEIRTIKLNNISEIVDLIECTGYPVVVSLDSGDGWGDKMPVITIYNGHIE